MESAGVASSSSTPALVPETVNDALVAPAAIVTCAGACAKPAGADSCTMRSVLGGDCTERVAVALPPATTPAAGKSESRTL